MFKRLGSIFLLFFFLVYITPSEVLHSLTSHTDTRHEKHDGDGLRIDPEHHHCKLLQDIQKLDADGLFVPLHDFKVKTNYVVSIKYTLAAEPLVTLVYSTQADRAPPVLRPIV